VAARRCCVDSRCRRGGDPHRHCGRRQRLCACAVPATRRLDEGRWPGGGPCVPPRPLLPRDVHTLAERLVARVPARGSERRRRAVKVRRDRRRLHAVVPRRRQRWQRRAHRRHRAAGARGGVGRRVRVSVLPPLPPQQRAVHPPLRLRRLQVCVRARQGRCVQAVATVGRRRLQQGVRRRRRRCRRRKCGRGLWRRWRRWCWWAAGRCVTARRSHRLLSIRPASASAWCRVAVSRHRAHGRLRGLWQAGGPETVGSWRHRSQHTCCRADDTAPWAWVDGQEQADVGRDCDAGYDASRRCRCRCSGL
jgi:hypothetical protein